MLSILVIAISCIAFGKIIHYTSNIYLVDRWLYARPEITESPMQKTCSILLLIPVIREQKVILQTIQHFFSMNTSGIRLYIAIAGTTREKETDDCRTTGSIVKEWLQSHSLKNSGIYAAFYCEKTEETGDRATQLNYAVEYFKKKYPNENLDYIGVYDADSLPSLRTLQEVRAVFEQHPDVMACQQPVHFIKAANRMADAGENPLLVANALYQTTWTVIRELPSWIQYAKTPENHMFHKNVYLIGHGEFLRYECYKKFEFPEFEVTDGIQLGYRMGMSNQKIAPLSEFCDDDVPQSITSLINQHKRWFGGCMNLFSAYRWSQKYFRSKAIFQLIDGYWSQACWAWASLFMIMAFIVSLYLRNTYLLTAVLFAVFLYSYFLPYLAHHILPVKVNVRICDWLVLPLAIALKGIGPNWFLLEKIFRKKVRFKKVER